MDNPKDSPIILVVGKDSPESSSAGTVGKYGSYKASIAAVLSNHGYNVKETTDIHISNCGESLVDARTWISKNSLRRFEGQDVKVICAMDTQHHYDESWVDIMCLIFKKHSPWVAAIRQDKSICSNKHLKKFFSDLDREEVLKTIDDDCVPKLKEIIEKLKSFNIKVQPLGLDGKKDVKAWSSEKVILFGRTGSGKSTVAQMLTVGHLNAPRSACKLERSPRVSGLASQLEASPSASGSTSQLEASPSASGSANKFEASSSARGMTKDIARGEGRGWHVTDTPGFGEAKDGTVSTKDATKIIKKFVIDTCGIYSHYVYVVKKDRMNVYDERLWEFFNKVFAAAETNFTIAVTGCIGELLTPEDKNHLEKNVFKGCKNFIYLDFPPVNSDDSDVEEENVDVRADSLRDLEDGLARLGVADRMSSEGEFSKETLRFIKSNIRAKFNGCSTLGDEVADEIIIQLATYLVVRPFGAVAGLFHKSKIDENFFLLPQ